MLTKRGKTYYLDIRIDGARKRISTGTGDYNTAKAMIPTLMAQALEDGKDEECGMTVGEGFKRLFIEEWNRCRDIKGIKCRAQRIEDMLGKHTALSSITRDTVVKVQAQLAELPGKGNRPSAPATVNRNLAPLIKLLNTAAAYWGEIDAVPKVRPYHVPESVMRALSEDEIAGLMENTRPEYHRVWTFLIETGLRMGEFLTLEWHHIDLQTRRLTIQEKGTMKTKRGKAKVIPLVPATVADLRKRQMRGESRPFDFTYDLIRNEFDRGKKAMGLEDDLGFNRHSLRHTCASRLISAGVPTATVQKWLGHSQISTTTRYIHQSVEDMEVHVAAAAVTPTHRLCAVK